MKYLNYIFRFIVPALRKLKYSPTGHYITLLLAGGIVGFSTFCYIDYEYPQISASLPFPTNYKISDDSNNKNFIANIAKQCAPSVVTVRVLNNQKVDKDTDEPLEICKGSGFVVKSDGWILTNAHNIMLKSSYTIDVIMNNGTLHEASIVDVDLQKDLALLKIDMNNLQPLILGNSKDVTPGEWVVALGSAQTLRNTITAGVISSVDRDSKQLGLKNISLKYIQTDAALTYEHAGGPLVNLNSEVIGINNLKVTPGIAFAIPADYAKEFLMKNSFKFDNEQSSKVYSCSITNTCCGITTLPIPNKTFQNLIGKSSDEDFSGVLVWNVVENSPAHKAGILPGDLITHINKKPVRSIADVYVKLFWESEENAYLTVRRRGLPNNVKMKMRN